MNRSFKKNLKGFTLIELLVVIAIIGLLSSIVLASLNSARAKSRDARRKTDLSQIQTALAFYYDKYGGYPTSAWNDNGISTYTVFKSIAQQANFTQFLKSSQDPLYPGNDCYNAEYVYISESFRDPGTLGQKYVLYATLEDQSMTNLNPATWPDNNMTTIWKCAGYGTPNYRLGDLVQ